MPQQTKTNLLTVTQSVTFFNAFKSQKKQKENNKQSFTKKNVARLLLSG
jgi:hypothetical protein